MAKQAGAEVINFKEIKDVPAKIYEMVDIGLDVAIDCGTFHEPKTLLHKIEKALMLETDVSEIHNEMLKSVRKMGRCGIIAAYAGFTNHFNSEYGPGLAGLVASVEVDGVSMFIFTGSRCADGEGGR
jgi:threonine dehydrogenase-like Zn-dependent dehydrogenase